MRGKTGRRDADDKHGGRFLNIADEDAVEAAENLCLLLAIVKEWDKQASERDDSKD